MSSNQPSFFEGTEGRRTAGSLEPHAGLDGTPVDKHGHGFKAPKTKIHEDIRAPTPLCSGSMFIFKFKVDFCKHRVLKKRGDTM